MSTRVDEVERGPVAIVERTPDRVLVIHRNREIELHLLHGAMHVRKLLLECELWRVHADYDQSLPVPVAPRANIRQRAQPVDTGIGSELHEHDFSVQCRGRRRWRVEPLRRTAESRDLAWLALLRPPRIDYAESRGGNRNCCLAQKVPAAMIEFVVHVITHRSPPAPGGEMIGIDFPSALFVGRNPMGLSLHFEMTP